MTRLFICFIGAGLLLLSCHSKAQIKDKSKDVSQSAASKSTIETIEKTPQEWREILTDQEYYILREAGTERAFTGKYWDNKEDGIYTCAGCDLSLFDAKTKYKSGTGWPSYYAPIKEEHILEDTDYKIGYPRTEVLCARCSGHLGHVFDDGPRPTGLRYCLNSAALHFVPRDSMTVQGL